MSDESLNDLARSLPQDAAAVASCRNVGRRLANEQGDRIAAVIAEALEGPMRPLSGAKAREETAEDRMRIDALWSALSLRCLADHIAPTIMTSRSELARWYLERQAGATSDPLFDPASWRHDAAGAWLEAFLNGQASLELGWEDGRLVRGED